MTALRWLGLPSTWLAWPCLRPRKMVHPSRACIHPGHPSTHVLRCVPCVFRLCSVVCGGGICSTSVRNTVCSVVFRRCSACVPLGGVPCVWKIAPNPRIVSRTTAATRVRAAMCAGSPCGVRGLGCFPQTHGAALTSVLGGLSSRACALPFMLLRLRSRGRGHNARCGEDLNPSV